MVKRKHRLWFLRKTGVNPDTGLNRYWYHDPFTDIHEYGATRAEVKKLILSFRPEAFPQGWYI